MKQFLDLKKRFEKLVAGAEAISLCRITESILREKKNKTQFNLYVGKDIKDKCRDLLSYKKKGIQDINSAVKKFERVMDKFYLLLPYLYEIPREAEERYGQFREEFNSLLVDLEKETAVRFGRARELKFITHQCTSVEESIRRFVSLAELLPGLAGIVLYGSVARGEPNPRDIDVLLIFEHVDPDISKKVEELNVRVNPSVPIRAVLTDLHDIDQSLLKNIVEEGRILGGRLRAISILPAMLGKAAYSIITYRFSGASQRTRAAAHRLVYGYRGEKMVKGKKYLYERRGLGKERGAIVLGKGVIALPKDRAGVLIDFFEKNFVKYNVYDVWL